jgi:hypothetical protein
MKFRWTKTVFMVVPLAVVLVAVPAAAQDANMQARGLIRDGMNAYSNLDLETANALLEEALGLAAQMDEGTLARAYVSLGVLWVGGYTDNAKGQDNFKKALCLDSSVSVDPLLSSPEVDMMFNLSKSQATPAACPTILAGITTPGGGGEDGTMDFGGEGGGGFGPVAPAIQSCGMHDPLIEQKQKYELPFYLDVAPNMRGQLSKLTVYYAFDSSPDFKAMPLPMRGSGYGAMLDCDRGQIRVYDPASISYYIEGTNAMGQVVCGFGTKEMPIDVMMMSDIEPLPSIAGLMAKECAPCPPWDEECGKVGLPQLGEPCQPSPGCDEGMICSEEMGICEIADDADDGAPKGHKRFYVNVTAGVGFGYLSKDMTIRQVDYGDPLSVPPIPIPDPDTTDWEGPKRGTIVDSPQTPKGFAWGGIPLRLAVGFLVIPKLSIELSGRFDVYVTTTSKPKSCLEAAGGDLEFAMSDEGPLCDPETTSVWSPENEEEARLAVARDENGQDIMTKDYQYAWLINARVRYAVLQQGGVAVSIFGGLGYGHMQYRIEGADGTPYFPLPGAFDIELGAGFGYYFNDHIGLLVEVPIDFLVGDGFALNFDITVGFGVGF